MHNQLRGHSTTTWTEFAIFAPLPPPLRGQRQTFFYTLPTTHLVHVFIEWPLIRRRLFFKSTLLFYKFEYQKERHLLILLSMLARYSSEPKLKMIFEMLWVLFERISVFYNDWPRSWISQTLGHVMDILNVIFIILQFFFSNFMHGFKSVIFATFQF